MDELPFSIRWEGFPDDWKMLSYFGASKSTQFTTNIPQLMYSLRLAGKVRIYQISDNKNTIYLSLYGSFDQKDLVIATSLGELIRTQREFFHDHDFPYYLVSLIEGKDPYSMGAQLFIMP